MRPSSEGEKRARTAESRLRSVRADQQMNAGKTFKATSKRASHFGHEQHRFAPQQIIQPLQIIVPSRFQYSMR